MSLVVVFIDLTRNCDLRKGDGTCQEVKWVDVEDVNLLESDKAIIKNGDWLTDRIIGAAQMLLKKQYQDMQGLQSTLNGDTLTFDVCKGAFLQVLNVGRSHWITIASEGELAITKINVSLCTIIIEYNYRFKPCEGVR